MSKLSAVFELPIEDIFTRAESFQNRDEKFSKPTFDKIVSEGYDKNQEPVYVWLDPSDNKHYILSGHSRFAAAQFLHNRDGNLKTIPVKEFKGTYDDAIDYATIRSNRESKKESLKGDVRAYVRATQRGYNKAELLKYFNPESYLQKLRDLSYLNPKGRFMELLETPEAASFPYLERNAQWVGQLKRQLPQLTGAHENEFFNYFYTQGTDALKLKRDNFFNLVDRKVNRLDFNPDEPLNLQKSVSTSGAINPALEHLKELTAEIENRQTIINKQRDLIARARVENLTDKIPEFEKEITGQTARIIDLATQIKKSEHDIAALERNTMFDLFSEEPVKSLKMEKLKVGPSVKKAIKQDIEARVKKHEIKDERKKRIDEKPKSAPVVKKALHEDIRERINKHTKADEERKKKDEENEAFLAEEARQHEEHREKLKQTGERKRKYDEEVHAIEQQMLSEASKDMAAVIAAGRKVNELRSTYSQTIDNASDNKQRLTPTKENLVRWMKAPGKFDLIGVDTASKTDATADLKHVKKETILHLLGFKNKGENK